MADNVNANINVNIDSSQAIASLQTLQSRISSFNQSVIQSNARAVAAQRSLLNDFQSQIGASRQFSTSIKTVTTDVGNLQTAIDKNRLSTGQYFKYATASSKNFGKLFNKQNEEVTRLATERVRKLQTQYIALGEAQGSMQKAMAVRPLQLFNADAAIATQRMQIFNKMLRDGGTSIVNWGKNTQWAGRQLMVGFTVPLTIFGATAGKIFMDLEQQAISFRKVYGDIFTSTAEVEANLEAVRELSQELTKYGIAITDTMEAANVAAQAGFRGEDLMAQTEEATRLAVLGQMEQSEAMRTTITLQNAFKLSNEELADSVNYLNIVENQTVLSIEDFAGAIPRVAPVIQSLGGDVRDLSVMLVAMREGGVTAAEGANALKTSLARLISPTAGATKMAKELGINLKGIIEANQGDILGAVMQLAKTMEGLDELAQQRLLSEIFGKRQYARIGALFNNITDSASQSARALDLAGMSVEELAATADNELAVVEEAIGVKFTGAIERVKLAIAPIGEVFLKIATPIIDAAAGMLEKFNDLSPTVKNFIAILATGIGVVVPSVLTLVGLFGNLIGQFVKGFGTIKFLFDRIRYGSEAVNYLTDAEIEAQAVTASLDGKITGLTSSLNIQKEALDQLTLAYTRYISSANAAAANLPQGFRAPVPAATQKFATGGMVGGSGNSDNQPALLTPGEFVMNRGATQKFGPVLDAMNRGTIKGFAEGSRLVNTDFGQYTAQSTSSASAIEKLLSSLVVTSENDTAIVASALERLQNEGQLTRKDLASELKAVGVGLTRLPDNLVKAHVFEQSRESLSASQVRELVARGGGEITAPEFNKILDAAEIMPAGSFNMYARSDLTVDLPAAINEGLKHGIDSFDFADAFDQGGVDKWSKTVKLAGVNAQEAAPQFDAFDRKISEIARSSGMMVADFDDAERGIISFGKIANQAMDELGDEVPLVRQSFDTLGDRFRTFQVSLNTEMIPALERAKYAIEMISENGDKLYSITGPGLAEPIKVRKRAQRESARGSYRGVKTAESLSQYLGITSVDTINDATQSKSPSRAARRAGDNVVDGFTDGLRAGIPESQSAARGLGEAATSALTGTTSDIRLILKERLGVGPIVEAEQAQLKENLALEKARNKEIEKRALLIMRLKGVSPDVARRLAGEQIAAEAKAPAVKATVPNLPVVYQKSLTDAANKIQSSSTQLANNTRVAAQKVSRIRVAATKFTGALKKGSMKMQGAFFALDGLVFAASMMDNGLGQVAQTALPLVFGLQGLTMVLPLLTNPVVLAAAAVGSMTVGAILLNKRNDELQRKMIEATIALDGSAKAFNELSKDFGSIKPSERFASIVSGNQGAENDEEFQKAQQFLETESGRGMVERARSVGGRQRIATVVRELTESMALDLISPDQAKAIAKSLSVALKDPALGMAVVSSISEYIRGSGRDIKESVNLLVSSVSEDVLRANDGLQEQIDAIKRIRELRPRSQEVDMGYTGAERLSREEEEELDRLESLTEGYQGTTRAIGPLLNASMKLMEAQAHVNVQFRKGAIDSEYYQNVSAQIAEENTKIADSIAAMVEIGGEEFDFDFKLRQAAESLGMTSDQLDAIDTQVEAIVGQLSDSGKDLSEGFERNLRFAMTTQALDVGDAANITSLMTNEKFSQVIDIAVEADDPAVFAKTIEMLNQIDSMPNPIKNQILMDWNGDWDSPEDFLAWQQEALINSSYFATNERINVQTYLAIESGEMTNKEAARLEKFYEKADKQLGISLNIEGLSDLKKADYWYRKFEKSKDIKKTLELQDGWSDAFEAFGITYEKFSKLPNIKKAAIMLNVQAYMTLVKQYETAEGLMKDSDDMTNRLMGKSRGEAITTSTEGLISGTQNIIEEDGAKVPDVEEEDGGSSGGSQQKTFLEKLLSDLKANTKLFNTAEGATKKYITARGKFFGMLEQLRRQGIPEGIIAMIGTGADGVKNAKELLDATAKERRQLLRLYGTVVAGEAADEIRVQQSKAQIEVDALTNMRGLPQNVKDFAIANEKLTLAFAGVEKGSAEYKELVELAKSLVDLEEKRDYLQESISEKLREQSRLNQESRQILLDAIDLEMDRNRNRLYEEFAQKMGTTPEMLQHTIDLRKNEIEQLEREVARYDEIIEAEQARIDAIQDTIDARQRDIDLIEYQNELDQRKIDDLEREDELRQRVSSALQHDLDLMSDVEQKISDAYQERFDALDKVAEVNDRIISQQKQQIDLSRAISEGDIYSATAAVQEMRAAAAGFAADDVRSALQAGMENQIDSLRTSGGLTREQAEQQIANIQEQSYQASLNIRDIQDDIYDRNKNIIPIKDEIYRLNQDIYNIEVSIANQEEKKNKFIKDNIEPLQWANEAQERLLRDLEYEVDEENGPLAAKRDHMQRHFDISTEQESLNERIRQQTENISEWTRRGAVNAATLASNWGNVATNALKAAQAISSAGGTSVGAFAGGMISKYQSGGGVSGSGGRDSVPAVLAPGEFVVRRSMVDKYGMPMFNAINQGSFSMPRYSMGQSTAGNVSVKTENTSNIVAPMYNNYSVNVSVSNTNASADEIANRTIAKIQQMQNMQIRSSRGY